MGTRGTFGVRVDGQDKLTYCQFDSYPQGWPTGMVEDIREILREHSLDWIREKARELKLVNADGEPTEEDLGALNVPLDLHQKVSTGKDWYAYLRDLQGEFRRTLEVGLMVEANDFIKDSLFCEYGYIANLDDMTFEVYEGFQKEPHDKGRYASAEATEITSKSKYYPCALVATFSLRAIPDDWIAQAFPDEEDEAA